MPASRSATRSSPASAAGARRSWRACSDIPAVVRERAGRGGDRDGADREHPARGSESAGRGAGARAADQRIRADARAGRGGGRPLARGRVSNLLRLLELAAEVCELVERRELEMGHARALARARATGASRSKSRAGREEGTFGARDRGAGAPHAAARSGARCRCAGLAAAMPTCSASNRILRKSWARRSPSSTRLSGKGKLVVSYNSLDELDGILAHIQ